MEQVAPLRNWAEFVDKGWGRVAVPCQPALCLPCPAQPCPAQPSRACPSLPRLPCLQGLVVRDRFDAEHLEDHKLPYTQVGGASEVPRLALGGGKRAVEGRGQQRATLRARAAVC